MAINPNIALQVRAPQFENPVNQLANVLKIQGLQQEQGMNRLRADKYRMEMDDYKRGQEENALLSRLYSEALKPDGTIDRKRLFSGAASGGLGSKIPGLQKTFADQDKATTDADAAKFKLAKDRYGMYQQTLGALSQEPNLSKELVLQAGQSLVQQGILPAEMFQQAAATLPDDPEQLRARLTQGLKSQLTPEQVLTLFAPKPEKIDNGGEISFRDTNPNSPTYGKQTGGAPVQKVQVPLELERLLDAAGITDPDQRTALIKKALDKKTSHAPGQTINLGSPVAVELPGGGIGYVQPANKPGAAPQVLTIDGKPALKPAGSADSGTEGEKTAAGYAARMAAAEKIISDVAKSSPDAQKPGVIEQATGGVGIAANATRSDARQKYRQAQEDWVRAKLRKESGAVIAADEMEREISVYFPQILDKPGVIKQKADARKVAEQGMRQAAGRAGKQTPANAASVDSNQDPLGLRN